MKILFVLLIALPISCWSLALDKEIKLEVSDETGKSDEATITKRSGGSFDFVSQIKKGILSGAGRASAALVSGSSGSSSSYNKPSEEVHGNSVESPWSFKKSVLNTIFQAVKAITGGVTAIKGQIIKGSGYALSAGGSLIAASGDKITDVGKGIVNSAQFAPAHAPSPVVVHPVPSKFSSFASSSSGGSHGPISHGETITSYEIPSGHQSYGPPSKTPSQFTSTSYLPPGTYTTGLHYAGPSSFDSSAHAYLPPGEVPYYRITHSHHHHDNDGIYHNYYLPPDKHLPPTKHYTKVIEFVPPKRRPYSSRFNYFNSNLGLPPPFLIDRAGNSASMVLKEIMPFLPKQDTNKLTATYNSAPKRQKLVDQYEIPSDPVPTYNTFKVGPITSISRSQTITTAFGTPLHVFQKPIQEPLAHNSLDRRPAMHQPFDSPHHSYDAYHALSMRQKSTPGVAKANPNTFHTPLKTPYEIPMKHLNPMPWKVSLNGPTPVPTASSLQHQPPSEPSLFLSSPYPSPPSFTSQQSIRSVSSSAAPPSPTPVIDIEEIVARLEAKKRAIANQSFPDHGPQSSNSRTDRQFSNAEENNIQKGSNIEIQKSVTYQITDPDSFNRELMYL